MELLRLMDCPLALLQLPVRRYIYIKVYKKKKSREKGQETHTCRNANVIIAERIEISLVLRTESDDVFRNSRLSMIFRYRTKSIR